MKEPIITTKTFLTLLGLIVAGFLLSFVVTVPAPQAPTPVDQTLSVRGVMTCLPHLDPALATRECAYGIKSVEGVYYALDLAQTETSADTIAFDQEIVVSGHFTPLAALSSDQWQQYMIEGIISVDSIAQ